MNHSQILRQSGEHPVPAGARLFLVLLQRIAHGHLELVTPHGTTLTFGDVREPPSAQLRIHDWRGCARILRSGDMGFAEAYAAGWIDTPDLTAVLRLALRNSDALPAIVAGQRLAGWWYRLRHLLRPNTRRGSQRNIHAHYDLGNDFYQLWLDGSMTYSSAIFEQTSDPRAQTLAQAQEAKYRRIVDKLGLRAGDHVLEIGCGWGGFMQYAAARGIRVHGVTVSRAQWERARQNLHMQGLAGMAQVSLRDYRDLDGTYDAVVSIEMFEAVGERYWAGYFETVAARLKPGGRAMIQTITIDEAQFARYRASSDFIREYIFPGGMLPSPQRFVTHARRAGLALEDDFRFGRDYAETLRRWEATFMARREAVAAMGFDERFLRLWQMYYAYCEAGFEEDQLDVVQFLLRRQ